MASLLTSSPAVCAARSATHCVGTGVCRAAALRDSSEAISPKASEPEPTSPNTLPKP